MKKLGYFALAVETIDRIEACDEPRGVIDLLAGFVKEFGFTTVGVSQMANPAVSPGVPIRFSNWPREWADYWSSHVFLTDPIAKMALSQQRPFRWSEAFNRRGQLGRRERALFGESGFADGLAIPIRTGDGPPGCVSLGCSDFCLTSAEQASIELVAIHGYVRLEKLLLPSDPPQPIELTRRESEVLHFVAAGKTNWEIGTILSISANHVRDLLGAVYTKLNAVSRAHAVATAIRNNVIFP